MARCPLREQQSKKPSPQNDSNSYTREPVKLKAYESGYTIFINKYMEENLMLIIRCMVSNQVTQLELPNINFNFQLYLFFKHHLKDWTSFFLKLSFLVLGLVANFKKLTTAANNYAFCLENDLFEATMLYDVVQFQNSCFIEIK